MHPKSYDKFAMQVEAVRCWSEMIGDAKACSDVGRATRKVEGGAFECPRCADPELRLAGDPISGPRPMWSYTILTMPDR